MTLAPAARSGWSRPVTTPGRSRKDAGDERGGVQAGGASAIWVNRLLLPKAVVFITVDGASLSGDASSPGADPHRDDGGEA